MLIPLFTSPILVGSTYDLTDIIKSIAPTAIGITHSVVRNESNRGYQAWFVGRNDNGQDGSGVGDSAIKPLTQISDNFDWYKIASGDSYCLGIKVDGTMWFWGNNLTGAIGGGIVESTVYPLMQVGPDNTWDQVYLADTGVIGHKTDGTLWFWGRDASGLSGSGSDDETIYGLTQIGADSDWLKLYAGDRFAIGLKTDGTLWFWGEDTKGESGTGLAGGVYAPTQIGSDTNWTDVAMNSSGAIIARKTNLELWFWGTPTNGEDGSGAVGVLPLTPVKIGASNDWVSVQAGGKWVFAIKEDGGLWFWGNNESGADGTGAHGSTVYAVKRVGGDIDWSSILCNRAGVIGQKKDGSIWFWGHDPYGLKGDGGVDSTYFSVTRIGPELWNSVFVSRNYCVIGVNNDGSLWFWGTNAMGENGNETDDEVVSPLIDMGTVANWNNKILILGNGSSLGS